MTQSAFPLTKQELQHFIEEPYMSRGIDYFNEGNVEVTAISSIQVKGRALGTSVYRVELGREENQLTGYCTCPAYENWGPCKHLAAFGLAVLQGKEREHEPSARFKEEVGVYDRVETSLHQKSKSELVDLILEIIADDPDWLNALYECG